MQIADHDAAVNLMVRCWDHNPAARPGFDEILEEIRMIRAELPKAQKSSNQTVGNQHEQ